MRSPKHVKRFTLRMASVLALGLAASYRAGADLPQFYSITDLSDLGGSLKLEAVLGINNLGQVVGYGYVPSGGKQAHAFLYSDGAVQDLSTLAGQALAINDMGQ